jgi:methoxymalonate biosynthesis acyl carrier protein
MEIMPHAPREVIQGFVHPRFPRNVIQDREDIFELGFVTSLFAMELVMFIEKEFRTQIPNEEMDLKNFRTIDAMVSLVDRLVPSSLIRTQAVAS